MKGIIEKDHWHPFHVCYCDKFVVASFSVKWSSCLVDTCAAA